MEASCTNGAFSSFVAKSRYAQTNFKGVPLLSQKEWVGLSNFPLSSIWKSLPP